MPVEDDDQVPPEMPSVSVVEAPIHTVEDPAIEPVLGKGLMVIALVAVAEPHEVVMV